MVVVFDQHVLHQRHSGLGRSECQDALGPAEDSLRSGARTLRKIDEAAVLYEQLLELGHIHVPVQAVFVQFCWGPVGGEEDANALREELCDEARQNGCVGDISYLHLVEVQKARLLCYVTCYCGNRVL
jgi:hypothetical protein